MLSINFHFLKIRMIFFVLFFVVFFCCGLMQYNKSKKEGKDQESIKPNTIPDLGNHMRKGK